MLMVHSGMASFDIPIKTTPEDTLNQVRDRLARNKGKLEGDDKNGSFVAPSPFGEVTGTYQFVDGQSVRITVTKKPFFLADSLIESVLTDGLNK